MNETDRSDIPSGFHPKTWKKLIPFIRPHMGKLAAVMALMLLAAVIDVALPLFQSYAVDHFIVPKSIDGLPAFIGVYLAALLVSSLLVVVFARLSMMVELGVNTDLKRACFIKLQRLSLSYFNTTPVGFILARVMSDTERLGLIIGWSVVDTLWSVAYLLFAFAAMFTVNVRMALTVLAVVPPIAVVTGIFQGKMLGVNREIRAINSRITGAYNEGITGAKTSKTLAIEDMISDDFSAVTAEMYRANCRSAKLNGFFIPTVTFLSSAAMALVLVQGGHLVMENAVEFGALSLFISYSLAMLDPIRQVAHMISQLVAAQVNIERVTALLEQPALIEDSPEVTEKYGDLFSPRRENWEKLEGRVTFENVWFKYPDGEEYVLEDFSLDVPAGANVAIVGETGAGKSTLVNLACRFYEPTRGRILIDGVDYRERSQLWLHSSIGYVLQNPHLFSGTVADNIRYGKPDATMEEIEAACRLVSADSVAEKLENGYDTDVGEGGDRLSTGEKQLISFARAIIADPPIFILDEATSSIDTETELLIQRAISHILKGRTSFMIAHRLSTVREADIILVVEDGKIVERGTHSELMAKGGHYAGLYRGMELRHNNDLEQGGNNDS